MQVILEEKQIETLLGQIATEIAKAIPKGQQAGLVGIRSRGEILANRLQKLLFEKGLKDVDCGTLDITLYRDDLNQMGHQLPRVRATEIDFSMPKAPRILALFPVVLLTACGAQWRSFSEEPPVSDGE